LSSTCKKNRDFFGVPETLRLAHQTDAGRGDPALLESGRKVDATPGCWNQRPDGIGALVWNTLQAAKFIGKESEAKPVAPT
jgi:hypothetical protein